MSTLLHLIRWNLFRDRFIISLLVLIALGSTVLPFLNLDQPVFMPVFLVITMLYLGLAGLFATRLVHTHPHTNDDSFWMTRPFGRNTQVLAQYLTCVLVLALPVFVSFVIQAVAMEGSVVPLLFTSAFFFAQMTAIFVAALFTRNVFTTAALVFVGLMFLVFTINALEQMDRGALDLEPDSIFIAFPICGALMLALAFMLRHYKWRAKVLYITATLVVPISALVVDFQRDDLAPNRSKDLAFSFRKDVPKSEHPSSLLAYTEIKSLADDVYTTPVEAEFQVHDIHYQIRYNESLRQRSDQNQAGFFSDRLLSAFPEDAIFYSKDSVSRYLRQNPIQGITATDKNGHGFWPREIVVREKVQGTILHQIYHFNHLELGELRSGASAGKRGHTVTINDLRPEDGVLRVSLSLVEFGGALGPAEGLSYALVFFCPETGEGLTSRIGAAYLNDMSGLMTRVGKEEISMPALETIAPRGEKVECHVFITRKQGGTKKSGLTVEPGHYDVEYGRNWSGKSSSALVEVGHEGFEESFIASLQKTTSSREGRTMRQEALAKLSPKQFSSLIDALERESIPRSVLVDSVPKNFTIPVEALIDLAEEDPVFFSAIRRYPTKERKKSLPLAETLLKKAQQESRPLPYAVTEIAADSNNPELLPALFHQFQYLGSGSRKVFEKLLKIHSHETLRPAVLSQWKLFQAGYRPSSADIDWIAALYGEHTAFLAMIEKIESRDRSRRPDHWKLRHLKSQLLLNEDQATWPEAKLVSWISREARNFRYDEVHRKWLAP